MTGSASLPSSRTDAPAPVEQLRRFSRGFSNAMGLLEPRYMGSDMTVAEARVLFEIARREQVLARDVGSDLALDAGYLSRILKRFARRGWIERGRGEDARERPISLNCQGRAAFATLDADTAKATERLIAGLHEEDRMRLGALLDEAGSLMFGEPRPAWQLRTFRTGDMGLVTARQSLLYDRAYGWGQAMEALIGEITATFLRQFQPGREQCWIAERDGRMLGSVFLVEDDSETARLRLLYVEPEARGEGIGAALVEQCSQFAREAGYRRIVLWTHAVLESARRIYAAEGYRVTGSEVHSDFGKPETSEHWLLEL